MATNSGARATTPRRGASAGADQRTPARGSRNGTGARPAARTSAVPSRSAPGDASQPTRSAAAASHPSRGSNAVATTVAAAAPRLDTGGSGPRLSSAASISAPAPAPAARRAGTVLRVCAMRCTSVRSLALVRPKRTSVAGSTKPPSSDSSGSAPSSARRKCLMPGRRFGLGSRQPSTTSHSSYGRSRRRSARRGRRRPSLRAVLAGPWPRTGFSPVHASYRHNASE